MNVLFILLLLATLVASGSALLVRFLFKKDLGLKRAGIAAGTLCMLTVVSACGVDSAADEVQTPSDLESEQAEVEDAGKQAAEEKKEDEARLAAEKKEAKERRRRQLKRLPPKRRWIFSADIN